MLWFSRLAHKFCTGMASPWAFLAALTVVLGWAVAGPVFDYSESWQLFINTTTTIVTFLMVFIIQHSQSRDTKAIQLKLAEIIRSLEGAHNMLLGVEDMSEEELDRLRECYRQLAIRSLHEVMNGNPDTKPVDIALIRPQLIREAV